MKRAVMMWSTASAPAARRPNPRGRMQRGFTLVELLVAGSIIAILASVVIPQVRTYLRTATTAEVSETGPRVAASIAHYQRALLLSNATLVATIDNKLFVPGSADPNDLSAIIRTLQLARDASFRYQLDAVVATDGPSAGKVVFCLKARGLARSGVEDGGVLFSSVPTTAPGWA